MAEKWTVHVAGKKYGPYTTTQMQAFVREGRLVAASQVMRDGDTTAHAAADDPLLTAFFTRHTVASFVAAENVAAPQRFGKRDDDQEPGARSHYVIVADMKSRSAAALDEEIFNFGPAYAIQPQVWVLSCDATINMLRNALVQKLGKLDMLFIMDATHDKAAWFNFGPEADTRIRRILLKQPNEQPEQMAS